MLHARALGLVLLAASATAPFQCASKVEPERRMEEEPAEALYTLAERFKAEGDPRARAETLRFITTRYPSSRFAVTALDDLATDPTLRPFAAQKGGPDAGAAPDGD